MSKPASKPAAPAAVSPAAQPVDGVPSQAPQQEPAAPAAVTERAARIEPTAEELLGEMGESDLQKMRDILSLDAARKKAGVVSPEDAELVRIYNKGRRRFDHLPWQSHPGAFCTVPRGVAKNWMRDYPADFVAGEDALKSIDGSAASLADANAKIKQLEAELAAAKK